MQEKIITRKHIKRKKLNYDSYESKSDEKVKSSKTKQKRDNKQKKKRGCITQKTQIIVRAKERENNLKRKIINNDIT